MDVCPVFEEELDDLPMSIFRCPVQRRRVVSLSGTDICPMFQEELDNLRMSVS